MAALDHYINSQISQAGASQEALYAVLLQVRNGAAVAGISKTDISTHLTLATILNRVSSPSDNLDQRAALNRANSLVALAACRIDF